jgi:aryl-alcohol dehydrogenase-like predicted oxidoreductase
MRIRPFGNTGMNVSCIGYGAVALSTSGRPHEDDSMQLLKHVLESGVTLIDTADTYCLGPEELHHNERLVAKAIEHHRDQVIVATKGGTIRTAKGWEVDSNPDRLYRAICESHAALGGVTPIPLWQHHWPDPRYSIAEMFRPVARAVDEGLVRFVGVGNYTLEQLKQACDLLPIVTIQNQYNPWHRTAESDGLFDFCEQRNLIFLPWRPLGGLGLAERIGEVSRIAELARERGVSPQRLVIAWYLHRSPCLLPIPGSRNPEHVRDCLAAVDLKLDPREIHLLNQIGPDELPQRERGAAWIFRPPLSQGADEPSKV